MIPNKEQLAEFKRLFDEANEVAHSHSEFLQLIFSAAVKLGLGEYQRWADTGAQRERRKRIVYGQEPTI